MNTATVRASIGRATTLVLLVVVVSTAPEALAGTVIDLDEQDVPVIHGSAPDEQFGYSCASGDLDGDGRFELVVGAPGMAGLGGAAHTGGVYIFDRAALDVLSSGFADRIGTRIEGSADRGRFGLAVAVGDLDSDGFDDLAVGAPSTGTPPHIARGAVAIFFGSASFPSAGLRPAVVLEGAAAGHRLGCDVLIADVDGDGGAELVASALMGGTKPGRGQGTVYVVRGSDLRTRAGTGEAFPVSGAAAFGIVGEKEGDALSAATVADTDGDGLPELVLGAFQADGPEPTLADVGRVYVVDARELPSAPTGGAPGGAALIPVTDLRPRVIGGITERGFFGRGLGSGDVDGDGRDDVIASAYASRAGGKRLEASGEAFLFFGGTEPAAPGDPSVALFTGRDRSDMLGLPVLLADLNGDSFSDVVIASQHADSPGRNRDGCGEVYVYRGSLRSVVTAKTGDVELADVTVVGAREGDAIGGSLLVADAVGGSENELVVGAPDAAGTDAEGEAVPRRGSVFIIPIE